MRRLLLHLLAVALTSMPMLAQAPTQRVKLVGLTFDHWRGGAGPALLRPTLRFTTYSPRGPGAEFAAVVFPDGISIQPPGVLLGLQGGLVQPITVGPVTFLPRAGGRRSRRWASWPITNLSASCPVLRSGWAS